MVYATKAIYARDGRNFSDKQGTGNVYVPTEAQLDADSKALTYDGTLQVAPAEGWRVSQIRLMNVDTSNAVVASLWVGTAYNTKVFIGAISVAAKSGVDGTVAATNGLDTTKFPDLTIDNAGKAWLDIGSGKTLFITSATGDKLKSFVTIHDYAE